VSTPSTDGERAMRRLHELFAAQQAEVERLRRDHATCRTLVESVTDMLSGHDVSGRFTWASASAEGVLGYAPEELVGRTPAELLHPEDAGPFASALSAARRDGRAASVTYRIRHRAGQWLWLTSALQVAAGDPSGAVVHAATRDVTNGVRNQYGQGALHRVAAALVREVTEDALFGLCALEVTRLLDCETAMVVRYLPDGALVLACEGEPAVRPGEIFPDTGDGAIATTRRTAAAARVVYPEIPDDDPVHRIPIAERYTVGAAVPVFVRGGLWGAVLVAARRSGSLAPESEIWMARVAELLGLGIAAAAQRTQLRVQATTDPLTGLANHRTFHERLRAEAARSRRSGTPLSLVLLDIDHFKRVNDNFGHQRGDEVLRVVAAVLAEDGRASDLTARLGGEEFALLLADTDADGALAVAERLRAELEAVDIPGPRRVTASFGVAALGADADPDELVRAADRALYAAKAGGRNRCVVHGPDLDLLPQPRSDDAAHDIVPVRALRVLARTAETDDPPGHGHGDRVADVAVAIATALGWEPRDVTRLRDAALVHAVPEHLAADVLDPEQVGWVRDRHRRWDGRGRGASAGPGGDAIPEGARIIALADDWDTMRLEHPDRRPATPVALLRRMKRRSGRHHWPGGVEALARLVEVGALPRHRPSPTTARAA